MESAARSGPNAATIIQGETIIMLLNENAKTEEIKERPDNVKNPMNRSRKTEESASGIVHSCLVAI